MVWVETGRDKMRVRPFFWVLLTIVCVGILSFAALVSVHNAVPMQARIDQVLTVAHASTLVRLHLADPEGMPIDQASVIPQVSMPAMPMGPQRTSVQALGRGVYLARISFSMSGLWNIDIIAHADGFAPARQSLQLMVT
jgi:nitrogen fixation protein FixH